MEFLTNFRILTIARKGIFFAIFFFLPFFLLQKHVIAAPCHNGHFYLLNPLTGDRVPINGMYAKENNRYLGNTGGSSCSDLSKWNATLENYDNSADPNQITRDSTISGSQFCIESGGLCPPAFSYDFRGAYHFGCSALNDIDRSFACSSGIIAWGPKTSPSATRIQELTGVSGCTRGTWSVISSTSTSTRPPQYPYRSWSGATGANISYPLIGWCDANNVPDSYTDFLFTPVCGSYCGDGQIQSPNSVGQFETCDDANDYGGDGCNSCNRTPTATVSGPTSLYVGQGPYRFDLVGEDLDSDLGSLILFRRRRGTTIWVRMGTINCTAAQRRTCTGTISWNPVLGDEGEYDIAVNALDLNVVDVGSKCTGNPECNINGCGTGTRAFADCDRINQRDSYLVTVGAVPPNTPAQGSIGQVNDCVDPVLFDFTLTDVDQLNGPNGLIGGRFRLQIDEKFDVYGIGNPDYGVEGSLAITPFISINSCDQILGQYEFTDLEAGTPWGIRADFRDARITCNTSSSPQSIQYSNVKLVGIPDFVNSGNLPSSLRSYINEEADFIEIKAVVGDRATIEGDYYQTDRKPIYRSHIGEGAVAEISWNPGSLSLSLASPAIVDYRTENVTSCSLATTGPCLFSGSRRQISCPLNQSGQETVYVDPAEDLSGQCNVSITANGVCGPGTDSAGGLPIQVEEEAAWFKTVNGDVYSRVGVTEETPGTVDPFLPFSTYYCVKKSGSFNINAAVAENLACSRFGWIFTDSAGVTENLTISYLDDLVDRINSGDVSSSPMRSQGGETEVAVYYNNGNFGIDGDIRNQGNAGGVYVVYGGDLTVASNVQQMEGFFIVLGDESNNGGRFIVESGNTQLRIKGSIVALRCGSEPDACIELNRNLGAGNQTDPAELIEYDPRYVVLFRELLGELGNIQFTESGVR